MAHANWIILPLGCSSVLSTGGGGSTEDHVVVAESRLKPGDELGLRRPDQPDWVEVGAHLEAGALEVSMKRKVVPAPDLGLSATPKEDAEDGHTRPADTREERHTFIDDLRRGR